MKITKATFKSFIKKNEGKLFTQCRQDNSDMPNPQKIWKHNPQPINWDNAYTYGLQALWLVNRGRDYFETYEDETYKGYKVYNCCGYYLVAIKK